MRLEDVKYQKDTWMNSAPQAVKKKRIFYLIKHVSSLCGHFKSL